MGRFNFADFPAAALLDETGAEGFAEHRDGLVSGAMGRSGPFDAGLLEARDDLFNPNRRN